MLDYPSQYSILSPIVSFSFALMAVGKYMKSQYEYYVRTEDLSILPLLHAESSGLKAFITIHVAEEMERSRRLCGGHGFLRSAGIIEIIDNYLALGTLEGTQQVLEPQLGRFMINSFLKKTPIPSLNYLTTRSSNHHNLHQFDRFMEEMRVRVEEVYLGSEVDESQAQRDAKINMMLSLKRSLSSNLFQDFVTILEQQSSQIFHSTLNLLSTLKSKNNKTSSSSSKSIFTKLGHQLHFVSEAHCKV